MQQILSATKKLVRLTQSHLRLSLIIFPFSFKGEVHVWENKVSTQNTVVWILSLQFRFSDFKMHATDLKRYKKVGAVNRVRPMTVSDQFYVFA